MAIGGKLKSANGSMIEMGGSPRHRRHIWHSEAFVCRQRSCKVGIFLMEIDFLMYVRCFKVNVFKLTDMEILAVLPLASICFSTVKMSFCLPRTFGIENIKLHTVTLDSVVLFPTLTLKFVIIHNFKQSIFVN